MTARQIETTFHGVNPSNLVKHSLRNSLNSWFLMTRPAYSYVPSQFRMKKKWHLVWDLYLKKIEKYTNTKYFYKYKLSSFLATFPTRFILSRSTTKYRCTMKRRRNHTPASLEHQTHVKWRCQTPTSQFTFIATFDGVKSNFPMYYDRQQNMIAIKRDQ